MCKEGGKMDEFDEECEIVTPCFYSNCQICGDSFEVKFPSVVATSCGLLPNLCDDCSDYLTRKKGSEFKITYFS